jgi:hypothetical protein
MRMRVCYLVIHIETLLRPLHLFYFHLWPIYWLSLVYTSEKDAFFFLHGCCKGRIYSLKSEKKTKNIGEAEYTKSAFLYAIHAHYFSGLLQCSLVWVFMKVFFNSYLLEIWSSHIYS